MATVENVGEIDDATGLLISLFLYLLLLIFHSLVLLHFLYKIYGRELSTKIKCTTLCVLLVTWIGLCFEFTILSLNVAHVFTAESTYCSIIIWFKYNIFILFELTLYFFWITRITHTFKFSYFEIKNRHANIIKGIISAVCFSFIIMISISMQAQYKEINVSLFTNKQTNGFDCVPKWNIIPIYIVYIVAQIVTLLFNLFFATLFFYKLNALQKVNNSDTGEGGNARRTRLFQLTQKHTLLALLSVFTSIICWVLFDVFALSLTNDINQDLLVILSFDRVVKSLCIILMYKFYEDIFSKLCCLCLRATNVRCMPTKAKELFPYFDPIQKKSIYQQSPDVAELDDVYGEDVSLNESIIRELEQKKPPERALPKSPKHLGVGIHTVIDSMSKEESVSKSKSRSYEKALPQMDFRVKPYKLRNFIACLTDPQSTKARYLDYSVTGFNIISSHIFNTINEECDTNNGVIVIEDYDSNQKFSFLQKKRTKFPYQLAIRLKEHEQHIETAAKLLKYAEYELNQEFHKRRGSNSFSHEPCFDRIATELASGKLQGGNPNFMVFDGSASGFGTNVGDKSKTLSEHENANERTGLYINAKRRNLSNLSIDSHHSNKQLPPITPPLTAVEPQHDI